MDDKYIAENMKAIVAFEIELTDIQHVFKFAARLLQYQNQVQT